MYHSVYYSVMIRFCHKHHFHKVVAVNLFTLDSTLMYYWFVFVVCLTRCLPRCVCCCLFLRGFYTIDFLATFLFIDGTSLCVRWFISFYSRCFFYKPPPFSSLLIDWFVSKKQQHSFVLILRLPPHTPSSWDSLCCFIDVRVAVGIRVHFCSIKSFFSKLFFSVMVVCLFSLQLYLSLVLAYTKGFFPLSFSHSRFCRLTPTTSRVYVNMRNSSLLTSRTSMHSNALSLSLPAPLPS